jgi:hypothetical protein
MRHSTPLLTAKLYIDVEGGDMMQALEQLPVFVPPSADSHVPEESPLTTVFKNSQNITLVVKGKGKTEKNP